LPFSYELLASQQTAVMTALAFVLHARPEARICSGRLVFLGGGTRLSSPTKNRRRSLQVAALRALPPFLRPLGLASTNSLDDDAGNSQDQGLIELAGRSSRMSVTCLAGTAERLRQFLQEVRRVSGKDQLRTVWPDLSAVLLSSDKPENLRAELESSLQ